MTHRTLGAAVLPLHAAIRGDNQTEAAAGGSDPGVPVTSTSSQVGDEGIVSPEPVDVLMPV